MNPEVWRGSDGRLKTMDWAGCTEVEVCEVCGRELCDCRCETTAVPQNRPRCIYQSITPKILDMGNYLVQDGKTIGWHPGG